MAVTVRADGAGEPVRVPAGTVILRYLAEPEAPAISIEAGPEAAIGFLTGRVSGSAAIVLAAGSPGVALQSDAGGTVLVSLAAPPAAGDIVVRLGMDVMVTEPAGPAPSSADPGSAPAAAKPLILSMPVAVLAHVSRRGDMLVEDGGWVCGPGLPLAIEGFELRLAQPLAGLDILSSAIVDLRGRKVTAPHPLGSFVGTRGRATPLLGVTFALSGPLADQYILRGEALFLGAAIVARAGRRITLAGSGDEPLLGLRLSLERLPQAIAAPAHPPLERVAAGPAPAEPPKAPQLPPRPESNSRVRIFRAQPAMAPASPAIQPLSNDRGTAS